MLHGAVERRAGGCSAKLLSPLSKPPPWRVGMNMSAAPSGRRAIAINCSDDERSDDDDDPIDKKPFWKPIGWTQDSATGIWSDGNGWKEKRKNGVSVCVQDCLDPPISEVESDVSSSEPEEDPSEDEDELIRRRTMAARHGPMRPTTPVMSERRRSRWRASIRASRKRPPAAAGPRAPAAAAEDTRALRAPAAALLLPVRVLSASHGAVLTPRLMRIY